MSSVPTHNYYETTNLRYGIWAYGWRTR